MCIAVYGCSERYYARRKGEHQGMEYNDNERYLSSDARQQAAQMQHIDLLEMGVLTSSASPALALVGLGRAATYLESHSEALMGALSSSDWATRAAAVQVLGKQSEQVALE